MSPQGEVAPPAATLVAEDRAAAPTINGLVHYQVLARWAHGGMADIYVARQVGKMGFDKLVALKVLRNDLLHDKELRQMFVQEAKTAVLLNHPRIIQTYDAEETGDDLYLVMEFVQGDSVRHIAAALIADAEELPPAFALEVVHQVGLALDYAHNLTDLTGHSLQLVHRDVAPSNIMLTDQGGVKLLDFGIAKVAAAGEATDAGIVKGKFAYMPPEQLKGGELDRRTDIYALGLVCWELLTGKRALSGDRDIDVIRAAMQPNIPKPSEAGGPAEDAIDELVLQALAPKPEDRFANARIMAERAGQIRAELYPKFNFSECVRDLLDRYCADRRERLESLLKSYERSECPDKFSPLDLQTHPSVAWVAPPHLPATAELSPPGTPPGRIPPLPSSAKSVPPPLPGRSHPATVPPLPPGVSTGLGSQPPAALDVEEIRIPPPPATPSVTALRQDENNARRRWPWALALAAVLVCVGYFTLAGESVVHVVVASRPPGAMVRVGDELLGETPLDVEVRPGERLPLTLEMRGYVRAAHVVTDHERSGVELVLARNNDTATVLIRTRPPGATVRVDGSRREGLTPRLIEDLWVGTPHRISVTLDGFEPAAREVDLAEAGQSVLEIELTPAALAVAARAPTPSPPLAGAAPRANAPASAARAESRREHSRDRGSERDSRRARPASTRAPRAPSTTRAAPPPPEVAAPVVAAPAPVAAAPSPPSTPTVTAPAPPAAPAHPGIAVGNPRIAGMIDRDAVRHQLRRSRSRLQACVASENRARPRTLALRFAIHDTGHTGIATLTGATTASNGCVNRVIAGLTFPPSRVADAVVRVAIELRPL